MSEGKKIEKKPVKRIYVDEAVHNELKAACAIAGITLQEGSQKAIKLWLKSLKS